ncbi:MAG: ferrochelatase, partial [Sphingomonadales bacterium]
YWRPFANEAAEAVKAFCPEKIILLPLYPQFSMTTSASSMEDWKKAAQKKGINVETMGICCFPRDPGFVKSHIDLIKPHLKKALAGGNVRILFSAHGLPEKVVAGGDPYAWQVEETVSEVVAGLGKDPDLKEASFDHVACYQSRVGPLQWLEPSTENEIIRAGADGKNLLVVPIAFVSEHSETLVELDMNYLALANAHKIKHYARVPALAASPAFIDALAGLVRGALDNKGVQASAGDRICPEKFSGCPCKEQP